MTTLREVSTLRRAAAAIQADLTAATRDAWSIEVADDFVVSATRRGEGAAAQLPPELDEDDWEWDDLDAEILPTTLWHDATEAVWDVVDAAFYCWAAGIPGCPRPGGGPLLLSSGKWTCRAHAHDVALVGALGAALSA